MRCLASVTASSFRAVKVRRVAILISRLADTPNLRGVSAGFAVSPLGSVLESGACSLDARKQA